MLKFLNGKRAETSPNQPITFSSKTFTRNLDIATAFAQQFTSADSHTRLSFVLLTLAHKVAQGFNQPCPPLRTLIETIYLTKTFYIVSGQPHHTHPCTLSLISKQQHQTLAICLLKRANSQLPIQLYPLPLFSCQGRGLSGCLYIPYSIQLLFLYVPPIRRFSHQLMLMTSLFPVPTPPLVG